MAYVIPAFAGKRASEELRLLGKTKTSQNQASTSNEPAPLTQGAIFSSFMRAVCGDGGDDLPDYDTYYDAMLVATALGAKPTGNGKAGDNGAEWLFPDGTSVWIVTDASRCGVGLVGPDGLSILP